MAVLRVLRTAKATLSRTFYLDEVATDATGSVEVSVARLDGTVLQTGSAAGPVDHAYTFTWQGSDNLDELTVTWTATIGGDAVVLDQDVLQVVGGFYVGLSEARSIDPVFRDTTRYPTADIADRRIEVEDECERICGQAFVPRFARDVLSGNGKRALALRWPNLRRVLSVTLGATALDVGVVEAFGADRLGMLRRDGLWTLGTGNVVVEYEHGLDRPPSDIVRGAKLRLKSLLLTNKSPLPDRAERLVTVDAGTVFLATERPDSTGIPTVDACYGRWPSPRPGFG